jgi:hypothetical protein
MKGATGRQIAQQRRQTGDAGERAARLERGQRGDQRPRVGVAGAGDDLGDWRHLDEPSGVHDGEAVDELRHQPHVVADQDHRRAQLLLYTRQGCHNLALHDDVERAGRLVGDDDLGPQARRDSDAGALLHAARELVRVHSRDAARQPDLDQESGDALFLFAAAETQAVIGKGVGDLTADAQHRVERIHRALRHQRDTGQAQCPHAFLVEIRQPSISQPNLARLDAAGRLDHPQHRQCQCRFAGAGLAR